MPNERNPPPQVPVRTYPTPDITDQVLVEWVTSQHANSHPVLPGTPHEVSREFPGFKLGKQDVNPRDENWFIRYWVMDQPTDSENQRDFWNYAIQFAQNSNIHPLYIRRYRIAKDGYAPLTKGSPDPSDTPNLYLVSEEAKQFPETSEFFADYFDVIRVFETLPGPYTCTTQVNEEEKVVTVCTRRNLVTNVPGATATEAGGIITETFSKQVDSVTSEESTSTREWLDKTSYEIEIPILIPEWARPQIPIITESHTLAGVASQPVLAQRELRVREAQVNDLLYQRTVTKIRDDVVFPVTAVNEQTDERYGGAVLEERLTLDEVEMTADEGLLVVDSKTTTLAVYNNPPPDGLFMKQTLLNPGTEWPQVHSTHVDERYLVEIDIEKKVLAAGTDGGVDMDGTIREVRSIDKWRSLQISSKLDVDSLPDDVTWIGGQNHSFPPELTDAIIEWAEATCGCSDSFSAVLQANMRQYTGPVKARYTEQFYNGAPPDDVTITQFFPQAHNFGFAWASACGDSDGNCRTKSGAPLFHIPLCLHDDLSLSIGALVWTFDATSPATLPHETYIMLPPHVERWRFGVFRRVLTEVFVPPVLP